VSFIPQEVIRRKRDGKALEPDEIKNFVKGLTEGSITEGQVAAFTMATFFRGMTRAETVALTVAMRDSGTVLDWKKLGLDSPAVVDKHSTGGVGDKTSLILGPLAAACGAHVPMISGRGLGHTGGTLDKFDSIPGYNTAPGLDAFAKVVKEVGVAIIGQTADLAPADRRVYAIRDVTATVESLPLITASILSKKLAAGLRGLSMDVKYGSGAFMAKYEDAYALAESIAEVASGAGVSTVALLTDMDQVLGDAAGNALEVAEAVEFLTGHLRESRLSEVTLALTAEMLVLAGLAPNLPDAHALCRKKLDDGSAAEKFGQMVAALGGPKDFVEKHGNYLPCAKVIKPVYADEKGTVTGMDARAVGIALLDIGGGRTRADQGIDYTVGLTQMVQVGQTVSKDRPLCLLHASSEADWDRAARNLKAAIRIGGAPGSTLPPVRDRLARMAP
jgi:thymidine phosphorylase